MGKKMSKEEIEDLIRRHNSIGYDIVAQQVRIPSMEAEIKELKKPKKYDPSGDDAW